MGSMTFLGGQTKVNFEWFDEMGIIRVWKTCKLTFAKCDNDKHGCHNFTTNHDLAGSWCCKECFIQHESPDQPRITRVELLQSMLDWNWDMDEHELAEIKELGLVRNFIPITKVTNEFSDLSDAELESKWQGCADLIYSALMGYYDKNTPEDKKLELYKLATDTQTRQSEIENEITRRHS